MLGGGRVQNLQCNALQRLLTMPPVQGLPPRLPNTAPQKHQDDQENGLQPLPPAKHAPIVTTPHPDLPGHWWSEMGRLSNPLAHVAPATSALPDTGRSVPVHTEVCQTKVHHPAVPLGQTEGTRARPGRIAPSLGSTAAFDLPADFFLPPAGRPGTAQGCSGSGSKHRLATPYALHLSAEEMGKPSEFYVGRLMHERYAWAAAQQPWSHNVHSKRCSPDLKAADAMWFDQGEPLLQGFPVRAQAGRYRS
jgi:hypothetical protein